MKAKVYVWEHTFTSSEQTQGIHDLTINDFPYADPTKYALISKGILYNVGTSPNIEIQEYTEDTNECIGSVTRREGGFLYVQWNLWVTSSSFKSIRLCFIEI